MLELLKFAPSYAILYHIHAPAYALRKFSFQVLWRHSPWAAAPSCPCSAWSP